MNQTATRLNKKDSYAIVKFLLPIVDIAGALKLKDYNSMKKCATWLGEIVRGMNWDEHMVLAAGLKIRDQWEAEGEIDGEKISYDTPSLFALGGVYHISRGIRTARYNCIQSHPSLPVRPSN